MCVLSKAGLCTPSSNDVTFSVFLPAATHLLYLLLATVPEPLVSIADMRLLFLQLVAVHKIATDVAAATVAFLVFNDCGVVILLVTINIILVDASFSFSL